MDLFRWRQGTEHGSELHYSPENPDSRWQNLVGRVAKDGLEVGVAGVNGQDLEERRRNLSAAARAELELLEQEYHGQLVGGDELRREYLQELLRRRAQAVPEPPKSSNRQAFLPWAINWRRAVAIMMLAIIAVASLEIFGHHTTWPDWALIAGIATLLALGPWRIVTPVSNGAELYRQAVRWVEWHRAPYRMDREIKQTEQELRDLELRQARANLWVSTRLDLLMNRFDLERARAETAAKMVRVSKPYIGIGQQTDGNRYALDGSC